MPTDLPNLLTLSRIAAIPVLVVLAALRDRARRVKAGIKARPAGAGRPDAP